MTLPRKQEPASPEHEKHFRATWRLREDVADDPRWQAAFEHAATHKLHWDELNEIALVLERKVDQSDSKVED